MTASEDDIRSAYVRERARWMAESIDEKTMEEALQSLDQAFAILSDAGHRAAYDRTLQGELRSTALSVTSIPSVAGLPTAILAPPTTPIVQHACPWCQAPNPVQATICRECGKQMSRPCPKCNQSVGLDQTICPRCQTFIPEYDQQRFSQSIAVEKQIQEERRATDASTVAADHVYRAGVRMSLAFWIVVILLCIGLAITAAILSNYLNR